MSSDTSPHTDASEQQHPRAISVVSAGPLLGTTEPLIDGRPSVWVPIQVPPLQLPVIATTMATGVDPRVHGIVTSATINPATPQRRAIEAADRRFPAFRTEAAPRGLRTMAMASALRVPSQ